MQITRHIFFIFNINWLFFFQHAKISECKRTLTLNNPHYAHAHSKRKDNNRRNTGMPRELVGHGDSDVSHWGCRQVRRSRRWRATGSIQRNGREVGKSPPQPPLNCKTETFTQENAVVRASHQLPSSQTLQPPDSGWRKVNDPSHLVQSAI